MNQIEDTSPTQQTSETPESVVTMEVDPLPSKKVLTYQRTF
ncbi:17418_t:CDS:2 [Funneliformis geosporum]|nr:17418_t:CDS:2 [Funneliformis geosporum]